MLCKIDEKLLWLASQLVKKFNWLTGKDNFFLARLFCACGVSALLFANCSWTFFLLAILWFLYIKVAEEISEFERKNGVKDLAYSCIVFVSRITNLFIFLCSGLFFLVLFPNANSLFFCIYFFFALTVVYVTSVDYPPYSKSRAWQLLKGKLRTFSASIPVLAPVPVES
jgi:hypothetical protein